MTHIYGGREMDISCLPGWRLGEVLVGFNGGASAIGRFLFCADLLLPMDGSDAPFRIAEDGFLATDSAGLWQYLDVFTSTVRSGSESFHLVRRQGTRVTSMDWRARRTARISRVEQYWYCMTYLAFRRDIYSVAFSIDDFGRVELLHDTHVSESWNYRPSAFDGPWQIPLPS